MLHRRDQCQCRLGALVEVRAIGREPVESATGNRIRHRGPDVVVSGEPSDSQLDTDPPVGIAGHGLGTGTRVSQRRNLDRLLVERRRTIGSAGAVDRDRRQVSGDDLAVEQPTQQRQSVGEHVGPPEELAGGDQRLGQGSVGVRQPLLGPGPYLVGRTRVRSW